MANKKIYNLDGVCSASLKCQSLHIKDLVLISVLILRKCEQFWLLVYESFVGPLSIPSVAFSQKIKCIIISGASCKNVPYGKLL